MKERTKTIATAALAVLLVLGMPVLAAHLTNTVEVGGSIEVAAPSGPSVTINTSGGPAGTAAEVDMRNLFPDANTVEVITENGNITFTSTGDTTAEYNYWNLGGTTLNVTNISASTADLTIDTEHKTPVTVGGDITYIEYKNASDVAVDDNTRDFAYGGPSGTSKVTLEGVPASTQIGAVDRDTNTILDVATSTSTGRITFSSLTNSDHNVELVTSNGAPSFSNPSPTGDLTSEPTTLSVDVSDPDFPEGDNVTVEISFEGSVVHTETITSNQTVTTSVPSAGTKGGSHSWSVEATDAYSQTSTDSYTYNVPDKLYIFNETAPHDLINGTNVSVTATITGSNETVFERTITDGKINFTGLPADETYIITLDAENFYVREVYVQSIYDQQAVFLLNKSVPSVQNSLSVSDRTGKYSDNPTIVVDRVINTSNISQLPDNGYQWVAIGGDRLGASGFYVIDLQKDSRYRFRVINQQGDTRVLGEYTAKSSGSIDLEIGSIQYDLTGEDNAYEWNSYIENETTGGSLTYAYNDPSNLTENVTLTIRYRENDTVLVTETFTNGPYGEIVYTEPLTQNQYENHSYVVSWSAGRDGEVITGQTYVGSRQGITLPLDTVWMQVGYAALILVFAFLVGAGVNAAAASLVVISFAGFGWYIKIVPPELGAGAIILGLMIAVIQHMLSTKTPQVR